MDSSANPWLDFLPPERAHALAQELNDDLEKYCSTSPEAEGFPGLKSIYGFGLLPLVPGISISSVLEIIKQINTLPHISGIIIGTRGVGSGLDDETLEPVWEALQQTNLVVFVHPHYGVDSKLFGDMANGHVLPLALGFPFETTIVSRVTCLKLPFTKYPRQLPGLSWLVFWTVIRTFVFSWPIRVALSLNCPHVLLHVSHTIP